MTDFDDIRPFNADESPAATQRMADSEVIPAIAQYLGLPAEALRERIRSIKTLKVFAGKDIDNRLDTHSRQIG